MSTACLTFPYIEDAISPAAPNCQVYSLPLKWTVSETICHVNFVAGFCIVTILIDTLRHPKVSRRNVIGTHFGRPLVESRGNPPVTMITNSLQANGTTDAMKMMQQVKFR
jgi:hypothetical protein